MADNMDVTPGTGKTVAADEVAGALHQRVKLSLGADGAAADALGGAGAVAAGVQRVTLASDDPAVASLAVLDDWDDADHCKVKLRPETANGLSLFRSIDLDETEEEVKASAGQVYGLWFTNTATATRWLKFYNATAANVTVGTTTPVLTLGLPGNTSDDISGLFGSAHGIAFDTAITVAATTGVADNDTGAPGANEVVVNVFYK